MKVTLKTIKQEIFVVNVNEDSNVEQLKIEIENQLGFDSGKIKILYNSLVLENSKCLQEYSISEDTTLIIANVKKKETDKNIITESVNVNADLPQIKSENKDDLGLYENEIQKEFPNSITSDTTHTVKDAQVTSTQQEEQKEDEDKVYSFELKAENAVQYVASIMKMLCLAEPQKGKDFFKNLEEDNPQIISLIKKNQSEFKSRLYSPKTEEDERIFKDFKRKENQSQNAQNVTQDNDKENIKKLVEFGFSESLASEAYYSNNKKFEAALNFLLGG